MRQDQYEKLQGLTEKLADVLIDELNPEEWPGAGVKPANMDRDTRGDRYWCKKNAAATLSALTRLHTIIGMVQRTAPPPSPEDATDDEGDLETEIASAEQEALRAIEAAQRRAKRGGKSK
jgi:hypothetical protein